jgi:hypothetical protein
MVRQFLIRNHYPINQLSGKIKAFQEVTAL